MVLWAAGHGFLESRVGCSLHTQHWLRQTSLPPKQTSLQLSGLVYEYKGDSDSKMQTSLPQ